MRYLSLLIALLAMGTLMAQTAEKVQAFPDTRIINAHSAQTLKKGFLEFRVAHKFGDLIGPAGGWETFYGLENASDIRLGFEYGITDRLMAGIGRTKGNGPVKRLVEVFGKYKLLQQTEGNWWPSMSIMANTTMSTMRKSINPDAISAFPKWSHRLSFLGELTLTRKFGKWFSVAAVPTYLHRNYVAYNDVNDMLFLGLAARLEFSEGWAVVSDMFLPFTNRPDYPTDYFPPLGIAIQYETGGGHIFEVCFTNNEGINPNDFLPYSDANWLDKQFRFGFRIVRKFIL